MTSHRSMIGTGSRAAIALACVSCVAYFVVAVVVTRDGVRLFPDTTEYALVARNLARGHGYTMDYVPLHLGLPQSVRRIPEMHGLLRPVVIASLFSVFGEHLPLVRIAGFAYVALTGLIAFLFARRLFGTGAGLLACFLTLTSYQHFVHAWQGVDDTGFMCLFLLTLHLLRIAMANGRSTSFLLAGMTAGVAVLEKPIGLFLPVVFLPSLLTRPSGSGRTMRRRTLCLLGPFVICVSLYLARNWLAHGGLMFRISPLEWMYKDRGWEALFALYDPPPRLWQTLASLGWPKVWFLVKAQCMVFLNEAFRVRPVFECTYRGVPLGFTSPPLLFSLAVLTFPLHIARDRSFAALCVLSLLGGVSFTCGLYHVEQRYFSTFAPLLAISFAGAVTQTGRGLAAGWRRSVIRWSAVGCGLAVSMLAVLCLAQTLPQRLQSTAQEHGRARRAVPPTNDAIAWLAQYTAPDDRVLSGVPWDVAWAADRQAIMIPAGGPAALGRVARHYGAKWLHVPRSPYFFLPGAEAWQTLKAVTSSTSISSLRVERVFQGRGGAVYGLRLPSPP